MVKYDNYWYTLPEGEAYNEEPMSCNKELQVKISSTTAARQSRPNSRNGKATERLKRAAQDAETANATVSASNKNYARQLIQI